MLSQLVGWLLMEMDAAAVLCTQTHLCSSLAVFCIQLNVKASMRILTACSEPFSRADFAINRFILALEGCCHEKDGDIV